MIKVVADKYVNEENKAEFLKIASELIVESRKEEGCISYGIFEDITDSSHVSFIEEWADEEAVLRHGQSEHYKKLIPLLGPLCSKNGSIYRYKTIED
ncbi:MAG: antibiotic biosynthesis monooxygenase [Clostridia bacterium]|nr:antibiotic biosynthesis monooxygenase [Clostridia bacterium]